MKDIKKNSIMKIKYISLLLTWLIMFNGCGNDENSTAKGNLSDMIQKANMILSETEEGMEEGDYVPGSKLALQTYVDWAYYILENSDSDKAYDNAASTLNNVMDNFYVNIVKAGIPHFDSGSMMNLGPCGDWSFKDCFTVECRVRYTELASGDQNIISCEGGVGGWMLRSSGNVVQFYINDAGGWNGCKTSVLELNRWYHIAASYQKGGDITLYLDGEKVGSSKCSTLSFTPITNLQVGTSPNYTSRYMRGYIQNLSLWKNCRTEQEVSTDVKCDFKGTEDGLNAYWPLNLNLGSEIKDITGNHVAILANLMWEDEIISK